MKYFSYYNSPVGELVLLSDGTFLTGLSFYPLEQTLDEYEENKNLPIFAETNKWLDLYFDGKQPNFTPSIVFEKGSDFAKSVWRILQKIEYGKTVTYGEIARQVAKQQETNGKMSAQAVGGAVGRNPVAIIVPCHRVVGANGKLVGYAGGLDKKVALLKIEKIIE